MKLIASLAAAALTLGIAAPLYADLGPRKRCDESDHKQAGEACEYCSGGPSRKEQFKECEDKVLAKGYTRRCTGGGASVWHALYCGKPGQGYKPRPQPTCDQSDPLCDDLSPPGPRPTASASPSAVAPQPQGSASAPPPVAPQVSASATPLPSAPAPSATTPPNAPPAKGGCGCAIERDDERWAGAAALAAIALSALLLRRRAS